ncbi:hypothetical protein BLL40_16225 [Domibacillus mangrovi]|uniref:Uncharacterized protein n=1 Tax=Domibacillus mangrovi TaxID=1714354 RepID=A0A1Q5NZ60_9BACI|nr:hypothetical protein BLL40_16225 [Domibacillus mangrovi]
MMKKILTMLNICCLVIGSLLLIYHLTISNEVFHLLILFSSIGTLFSLMNQQWIFALLNSLLGISLLLLWLIGDMIIRFF